MDFDQLVTFLEVAKLGSFSRAGQKVFRSQSAVSAQIRQLEQEYGDRLLDRSGKDVTLTPAGRVFVAYAERLTGPWRVHPGNPVRIDITSSRPGGTPLVIGDRLMAPMQDSTKTYGGALRPLWIDRLDADGFAAEAGEMIAAPASFAPTTAGLHTMSACGPVTLIDAKRIVRSLTGLGIEIARTMRGLSGRAPHGRSQQKRRG